MVIGVDPAETGDGLFIQEEPDESNSSENILATFMGGVSPAACLSGEYSCVSGMHGMYLHREGG